MRRLVLVATAVLGTLLVGLLGPAWAATPTGADPAAVGSGNGGSYIQLAGISYGPDPAQLLDVYLPSQGQGLHAGVLLIHGGGWYGGSRRDVAAQATWLAEHGLVAVAVDYRLDGPRRPGFPMQLQDVEAALAWVRQNAALLDLDPRRMGALGESAGGALALELGEAKLVPAVVTWSAPTDLSAFEQAPYPQCTTSRCGPLSLPYAVYRYLGCLPSRCPDLYRRASPADNVSSTPTAFMLWGSQRELMPVSQMERFIAAARRAGDGVTEQVLAGSRHAAAYAGLALPGSLEFLLGHL
jgi:acetyl esterase/lipase